MKKQIDLKKLIKPTTAVFAVFSLLCACIVSPAAASQISLNKNEVTIYALDEAYKEYISIPDSVSTSFQFSVSGTDSDVTWYVTDGDSVTIDENGVIKPNVTTWYWNGNVGSTWSSGDENERVTYEINFGESEICGFVDGEALKAKVNVENYAENYAESVITEYISNNITDSMTDMEKLEQICRFAASYDYSANASGYVSMIIKGGGDCWASTSCINHMCDLVGLRANFRYAANDYAAGSGHRNSTVLIDGTVYMVDAGYTGEAPRYYSIEPLNTGFSFKSDSNSGWRITQYDGFETSTVIPDVIGEQKVTEIDSGIFYYNQLYNDIYVTDVFIPQTVEYIDTFAFSDCSELISVKVSENNQYFSDIDGVLFSKNKDSLIYYPNGLEGDYSIPSSISDINEYAFYYSGGLTSVTIPDGVTELKEGTFGDCSALANVKLPDTLNTIGDFAFYNCDSLELITIPESVISISEDAFNSSSLKIRGRKGTAAEAYANENGYTFIDLDEKAKVGDVNGDSILDVNDVTYLQKYLAGYSDSPIDESDSAQFAIADFNGDNIIDVNDVTAIQMKLAGYDN